MSLDSAPTRSAVDDSKSHWICWQGWQVVLPRRWDAVKLEGDLASGHALFADAIRPRLGLRWFTPRKKNLDARSLVLEMLTEEVGKLAAGEAKAVEMVGGAWESAMLYVEPEPPGRDVFVGFSRESGRVLQVVYHAHRREHILAGMIMPTIADLPADRAMPWAVFDLSCVIPAAMTLASQRLNAGDLGLEFADKTHRVTVRQIALAELALQRMPLDGWIAEQQRGNGRYHRATGVMSDVTMCIGEREALGRRGRMLRRRRYAIAWWVPAELVTYALHDVQRDRVVILHGTNEALMVEIARTVGRAH